MQTVFLIVYLFEAMIAFMYFYDNFEMKKGWLFTIGTVTGLYLLGFAMNIIDKNTYVINLIVFFLLIFCFRCYALKSTLKAQFFIQP